MENIICCKYHKRLIYHALPVLLGIAYRLIPLPSRFHASQKDAGSSKSSICAG